MVVPLDGLFKIAASASAASIMQENGGHSEFEAFALVLLAIGFMVCPAAQCAFQAARSDVEVGRAILQDIFDSWRGRR